MALTNEEIDTLDYYENHAEAWSSQRKKLDEPSFWNEEYTMFKALGSSEKKLLEIGSGSGREAIEFMKMGFEYQGTDISKELIKIARRTAPSGQFFFSTPYHLPFKEKTFDAVSSWALLPHLPKSRIKEALISIKKVMKTQAVGFFAMREGVGKKQENSTGRWFSYYSQEEFTEILQAQGFVVEKSGRKMSRDDLVWLTFFVRVN